MKKFLLVLLLIICSCSFVACEEKDSVEENYVDAEIDNENEGIIDESIILFRDIPWYSTKSEVEKILFDDGASIHGWMTGENDIYRMSGTDYSNVTMGDDRVDNGGYRGWYANISVAGYDVDNTYVCYMYPTDDAGNIIESEDDALMYFGYYTFGSEYSDHEAIYGDLQQKLSKLYGEGTETLTDYHTYVIWSDAEGNIIRLLINADKTYVTLGYMASDAEVKLDELENILENENIVEEKENRDQNKDNTSEL